MEMPLGCIHFADGTFTCVNPGYPVNYVSWHGAAAYCDWLSLQQGLPRAYDHATWQCNNWYAAYAGDVTDPVGPGTGSARDIRGGSWIFSSQDCRSAARNSIQPAAAVHNLGLRPVRSAD